MENITDMMELDLVEIAESDDHATSFQSKTLKDMPVEVVEMILSHLSLKDKKNFGLTCKKNNEILSNCPNLWSEVWLRIPSWQTTPNASELTRKYVNVECYGKCNALSYEAIWPHLAANLKKVSIDNGNLYLSLKCLTSALPYFENIVHWDFTGIRLNWDVDEPILAIDQKQSAAFGMKKLKHLRMQIFIFFELNGRFVNFSVSPLKELDLYDDDAVGHDDEDDPNLKNDEKAMVLFVESQKDLEILRLTLNYAVFFDKPLKLDVQLREIYLKFKESLNANQQNNMCSFLGSQKGLELQTFTWSGQKTDRMLDYQMRLLDLKVAKQHIIFQERHELQRYHWKFNDKSLFIRLYSTDFLSFPHQENLNTEDLFLEIKVPPVTEVEALSTCIGEKFPNLTELRIDLVYMNRNYNVRPAFDSINLYSLRRLEKLKSLELRNFTSSSSSYRLLDSIAIPSLRKFVNYSNSSPTLRGNSHVMNLKNFMTRHVTLIHMEFQFRYQVSIMSEATDCLTEIFADSGFDIEMKFLEMKSSHYYSEDDYYSNDIKITLTKGKN